MAINQLSFMPGFGTDSQAETEEQRRQREEQERIQRESAMLAGLPGVAPGAVSPLSMTPEDAANTEVSSTQIKTYGDGSQEEIVKRQIPAAGPVDPMAAQAPGPAMMAPNPLAESQQNLNVLNPQLTPEQQAQAAQIEAMAAQQASAAQPMNMQQPMAQPQPQTMSMAQQAAAGLPQQQPQPQPMAQAAPIAPDQAMPEIGMPPTPGPAVQVASTAPAAGVAEAAQAQAAPGAPAWITAANEAGNDFDKLIQVAAQFPESRGALKEKMRTALEGQRKEKEAQDIVLKAAQGDAKAQNQLQQALRPETGRKKEEVTTSDYVKAYLYARLGLNELASEAQKKILGKQTKFGQVTLGTSNWQVETDAQGNIVGARDNEGTAATENTLNKLRAESRAVSTATPPSATSTRIRDSKGIEWSQVPTPQGMRFFDNQGKQGVPEGRTVPIAVGSDLELAQARQDMETVAKFGQQTTDQRLKAFEKTNALRADRGLPLLSLGEMGLNPDGSIVGEAIRRPGAPGVAAPTMAAPAPAMAAPAAVAGPVAPTPTVAATARPATTTPPAATTTPLVSTQTTAMGGGGRVSTAPGTIPTAAAMEAASKEGDVSRSIREADIKDLNKQNREFSNTLATNRQTAVSQTSVIDRLQSSIDRNPEFWGIDTNSGVWRAYVDLNSTNSDRAEALNTLARNLNIPKAKRAQFDQTMNDYRNLQLNAITGSGLTASQLNSERESQRVVGTAGSLADKPAAAKATLEYARAKIEYSDAKARAWAEARRTNPGIDRLAFEANFDATTGEKIFKDVNDRMSKILGQTPGGLQEGQTSKSKSGRDIIYRNGRWEYQ